MAHYQLTGAAFPDAAAWTALLAEFDLQLTWRNPGKSNAFIWQGENLCIETQDNPLIGMLQSALYPCVTYFDTGKLVASGPPKKLRQFATRLNKHACGISFKPGEMYPAKVA